MANHVHYCSTPTQQAGNKRLDSLGRVLFSHWIAVHRFVLFGGGHGCVVVSSCELIQHEQQLAYLAKQIQERLSV